MSPSDAPRRDVVLATRRPQLLAGLKQLSPDIDFRHATTQAEALSLIREKRPEFVAYDVGDTEAAPPEADPFATLPAHVHQFDERLQVIGVCLKDVQDSRIKKLVESGVRTVAVVSAGDSQWATATRALDGPDEAVPEERHDRPRQMMFLSDAMRQVAELTERYAQTDIAVLITGETGVGKELVARNLHALSPNRRKGPFGVLNCATLSKELAASEFFGHTKGAFSGAVSDKRGRFQDADGGSLFLDEIGELPLVIQPMLLRALQEGEVVRVGGNTPERVDVRVIFATHRDLRAMVAEGTFREDLYQRISPARIQLPPLRERKEDIAILVDYYLRKHCADLRMPVKSLSARASTLLQRFSYPGNVRQLVGALLAAISMAGPRRELTKRTIAAALEDRGGPIEKLSVFLDRMELMHIHRALAACDGNAVKAAELLGVSHSGLWKKLHRLEAAQ